MSHWILERLSSILRFPIVLVALYGRLDAVVFETISGRNLGVALWVILGVLTVVLFYHVRAGIESVLRDYVHTPSVLRASRLVLDVCIILRGKEFLVFVALSLL